MSGVCELEKRWKALKTLVGETQEQVRLDMDTKKMYDEYESLNETLTGYESWIQNTQSVAADMALDISPQLEQCRVCL